MNRPNQYMARSIDQMKALSNKLRITILNVFSDQVPRTNKQIAQKLGFSPTRVHYHVRELERVGLLEQVGTKQIGGIVEKYYLPIAINIYVVPERKSEVMKALVAENLDTYIHLDLDEENTTEYINILHFNAQEKSEFDRELKELYQKWSDRCAAKHDDFDQEWRFIALLFPNKTKENPYD